MAGVRFADMQSRPTEFLDFTSLTLDEFQQLIPPFEAAFQAHMAAWRLDGKPRTARQFTVYKNCPLPTPEDRLFFLLTYLKTYCAPSGAGAPVWHGPEQSQSVDPRALARPAGRPAHPWRCADSSLAALAQRLGVAEADAATVVTPLAEEPRGPGPPRTGLPPFAHDGTERRIVRPQDPAEQKASYSGKKKDHTVKNILWQCPAHDPLSQ